MPTLTLFDYHEWAVKQVFDHLEQHPDVFTSPVHNVFSSIADMIGHLIVVEAMWLTRMKEETPARLDPRSYTSLSEAKRDYDPTLAEMKRFLQEVDDQKTVTYQNSKGLTFQNTIEEIVIHLVNHGTYHRGNIASAMRQLGYAGPSTDYIFYTRQKGLES